MATGTVYLVGAGPGDPELLTVRAAKLLATAEAVVYDRLVPESIVSLAPPQAELFNVGKASGSHPVPQDSINSLLLRLAGEGKRVVRLKGGDPFVFGRGGEEAAFLARHDVPCIVVPGVTTAIAAPAAAGIPVTCRGVASTLAVASGHPTAEGDEPDWPALARIDTVVFMMGAANLERIVEKLVAAGARQRRRRPWLARPTGLSSPQSSRRSEPLPPRPIEQERRSRQRLSSERS